MTEKHTRDHYKTIKIINPTLLLWDLPCIFVAPGHSSLRSAYSAFPLLFLVVLGNIRYGVGHLGEIAVCFNLSHSL